MVLGVVPGGLIAIAGDYIKVLVPPTIVYDYVYHTFVDGLTWVSKDGLTGLVDTMGNIVVPLEYSAVEFFSDGLAAVSKDGKWGYVDRSGNVVIPLSFTSAADFSEGLAAVGSSEHDGKCGYIDTAGNVVIPFEYDWAFNFKNGYAQVRNDRDYYYIDKTGRVQPYDFMNQYSSGYMLVRIGSWEDGLYGLLGSESQVLLPVEYDYIDWYDTDGLFIVQKNGLFGVVRLTSG